jgi:hypothetical protein
VLSPQERARNAPGRKFFNSEARVRMSQAEAAFGWRGEDPEKASAGEAL